MLNDESTTNSARARKPRAGAGITGTMVWAAHARHKTQWQHSNNRNHDRMSALIMRTLIILPSLVLLVPAPSMAQQARIKIDTDRTIGEVDPNLFGNFAEHLGRCIYGGIYEPGSPLADQDGYRKDVMEAIKGLGVTVLRWPGGNFVSGYNWKDGIGPKSERPVRPEGAWGSLEPNQFGTDEFLQATASASA